MIPVRVVLLSPPPSPSRWKVGGGGVGVGGIGKGRGVGWGGGSWFAGASRDACFLLSGPKWNPDKNTPLVAACRLWVAAVSEVIGRGEANLRLGPCHRRDRGLQEDPATLLILTFSVLKSGERTGCDFCAALTCGGGK